MISEHAKLAVDRIVFVLTLIRPENADAAAEIIQEAIDAAIIETKTPVTISKVTGGFEAHKTCQCGISVLFHDDGESVFPTREALITCLRAHGERVD